MRISVNVLDGEQRDLPADAIFPVLFTAAPWVLGLAVQLAHSRMRTVRELATEIA